MKRIICIMSYLLLALTTQAALVDNFESYTTGTITDPWVITDGSPVFDEEAGGNMYMESYGSYRDLAGASISNSDTETTVFYRIYKPAGTEPDCSIGLSDLTAPTGSWSDFEAYVVVVSGELRARNGSGNDTIVDPLNEATWYNIWLVINNSADTYDVYVTTGSTDATIGDRVANDFDFRNGGSNDLVTFKVYGRGTGYGPVWVDDIYISSGTDLTVPSPGPLPPVIVSSPNDVDANETQTAIFTTVFTSETTPSVEWYKVASPDDLVMDSNQSNIDIQLSYDSQAEEYTSTLTMTDLTMSDTGQYYCQVNNDSGSKQDSDVAELTVYGLVAHWTLDQGRYADSNYLEEIAGYHAAAAGSPTFVAGANGVANSAVQISDTDGWALCPLLDPVKQSGQLTISFWVNWSETQVTQQDLQAESTESEVLVMSNGLKADGEWQHVCTVFNGSVGKLYVDGVLEDQDAWQLPADTEAAINFGITIDEQNAFNGAMDDVRLYNYALSDTDVAAIRDAMLGSGDTTPPAAPANLVAAAQGGAIVLNWDENTEPDLYSYNVYRSTISGSYSPTPLDTSEVNSYTDSTAVPGVIYYYVVTAVDTNSNESDNSNEQSAPQYPGDLTLDGQVDFPDFAVMASGWQTAYDMDNLQDIANDWLK